jgi:hypothetical protein
MPITRKAVRDAALSELAASVTGFNATLAALAGTYGVTPFTIDWSSTSSNFSQSQVTTEQLELSRMIEYPGCLLYTPTTQNQNLEKFRRFSGVVVLNIDVIVDFRDGAEGRDTESLPDAVEDAITSIFNRPTLSLPAYVVWNGDIECVREPVRLNGDGYFQRCPHQLTFEVHV